MTRSTFTLRRSASRRTAGASRGGDLVIDQLTVSYGAAPVLDRVDLRVAAGEAVALLGSNGAGKTTFLRTISGLLTPVSGRVTLGGADLRGLAPQAILQRGIAHVPQGRGMFSSLTVRENLLLGARLRDDQDAITADLEYIFDVFPVLGERLEQLAGNLSGGQQQALAIGRALMADPALLMLDEPSLGLAPRLVDDLAELLQTVRRDRDMGMLLVEQNAILALDLTDRAYMLQRGTIITEQESAKLAKDPSIVLAYLGGTPMLDTGGATT